MNIEEKTVIHIAELSKLKFSPEEVHKFKEELGKIIEYINKLKELEVKGKELNLIEYLPRKSLKLREDEPVKYNEQSMIFKGAPEVSNNYFVVPKIIEK
jgi:aspartyl-tRNA(Asn)/glutamyl-tRNA(Gln) amidotransferase subunit C